MSLPASDDQLTLGGAGLTGPQEACWWSPCDWTGAGLSCIVKFRQFAAKQEALACLPHQSELHAVLRRVLLCRMADLAWSFRQLSKIVSDCLPCTAEASDMVISSMCALKIQPASHTTNALMHAHKQGCPSKVLLVALMVWYNQALGLLPSHPASTASCTQRRRGARPEGSVQTSMCQSHRQAIIRYRMAAEQ